MNISAYVQVQVEVTITGGWDDNCPIEQVHKQVADEAIGKVQKAISGLSGIGIVGTPKMEVMFTKS